MRWRLSCLVAAVLGLGTMGSAAAETLTIPDARHDVYSVVPCSDVPSQGGCVITWEHDRRTKTADVTRTRAAYSDERLNVAVRVRKGLPSTHRRAIEIEWEIRTPTHPEDTSYLVSLVLHNRSREGTFCDRTNDDGTGLGYGTECRDLAFSFDRAAGVYRVSLPSSWLGDAPWVRLNGVVDVKKFRDRNSNPYGASVDSPFSDEPGLHYYGDDPPLTKRIHRG